jgi:hypothetical protein
LRKSFMVAGAATLAIGAAGVAYAQNPAGEVTVTSKITPSKAGTKAKPKASKIVINVVNSAASKTTAAKIAITFPSTMKLSTKGLPQCTATDDEILAKTPTGVCKSSIAGSGTASALLNPSAAQPAPLAFKVTPIVGKNELLFFLTQSPGNVKAVLHGKISGKKLTIAIPAFLQQPAPGTYSALNGLKTTMSLNKGKNSLISSTGCKSGAQKVGVTITYVPNPAPPTSPTGSGSGSSKCS